MKLWIFSIILTWNIDWCFCDTRITFLHLADIKGRYDENKNDGGRCSKGLRERKQCVGGLARVHHLVKKFRAAAGKDGNPHVLFFFNGNIMIGTEWAHYCGHEMAVDFLNLLQPDALTLGNHDFDRGLSVVKQLTGNLKPPVILTNVNIEQLPNFFMTRYNFTMNGSRIGVLGIVSTQTKDISSADETIRFLDEINSIREEVQIFQQQKIDIVVVLTSVGFEVDKQIALEVPHVDVVIGGMSQTFLYNGVPPDIEEQEANYPHIVVQSDGRKVPVLHAYAFSKYLGCCNITFSETGILTHFEGSPRLLHSNITQDEEALKLLEKYRPQVQNAEQEIGKMSVIAEGTVPTCGTRECTMGNLVTDAFVEYASAHNFSGSWTQVPIAIVHAGTLMFSLDTRDNNDTIVKGDLFLSLPYANDLVIISVYGETLKEILEMSVDAVSGRVMFPGRFLQVSGLRISYDKKKQFGNRITTLKVRCGNCSVPKYEPLDPSAVYRLILPRYLSLGYEGYKSVLNSRNYLSKQSMGKDDIEVLMWYIGKWSPVHPELQERILLAEVPRVMSLGSRVSRSTLFLFSYGALFVS